MVHTHNGIIQGSEKSEIMPSAATWMDLEIITLSEVSETEKDRYIMLSFICGIQSESVSCLVVSDSW